MSVVNIAFAPAHEDCDETTRATSPEHGSASIEQDWQVVDAPAGPDLPEPQDRPREVEPAKEKCLAFDSRTPRQLDVSDKETASLSKKLTESKEEVETLRTTLSQALAGARKWEMAARAAQEQLSHLNAAGNTTVPNSSISTLRADQEAVRARLDGREKDLESLKREKDALAQELHEGKETEEGARDRLQQVEAELQESVEEIATAVVQYDELNEYTTRCETEMDRLEVEIDELKARLRDAGLLRLMEWARANRWESIADMRKREVDHLKGVARGQ